MGSLVRRPQEADAPGITDCGLRCSTGRADDRRVEKALSGVVPPAADRPTPAFQGRLFGSLLSWLNDHDSDVFVVCTANDVTKLPPEFSRAERFDGIFFLDLPDRAQKDAIWRQYIHAYALDASQRLPDDAPVDRCRNQKLLPADCTVGYSARVSSRAKTSSPSPLPTPKRWNRDCATWASGRCLSAETFPASTVRPELKGRKSRPIFAKGSQDPLLN